jgi:transposase-like protein
MDIPQVTVGALTGRCKQAVCDWFNLCRDICVQLFEDRQPLGGPGERVEVDESLLRGKRKANRGRLLSGNLEAEEELLDDDPKVESIDNNRNYGRRISGPWVFGLCWRHLINEEEFLERRYFVVKRRDRDTLLPIILEEVAAGTLIVSDEWGAYNSLNQHNYQHQTVNHQHFFVDPITSANTQTIETLWSLLKMKILRKMHGTTPEMLPRHLKESWWRSINPKKDLFLSLLRDIRTVFL